MDFAAARLNMVNSQIRPNKVTDERLIAALETVPRELFVPPALRGVAYVDDDIPISGGRSLIEPAVLARLLQAARVGPGDVALDIGCGTGYSAAVLARLAGTVVALESDRALAARAAELFRELAIDNVVLLDGPLAAGSARHAPFQVILLDGGVDALPPALVDQLAEGGRLVAVVGGGRPGRATLMTRTGGLVSSRTIFDAAVDPLPGFQAEPGFVF